jgi:chorismate mutase
MVHDDTTDGSGDPMTDETTTTETGGDGHGLFADGGEEFDPADASLNELREEIEDIDRELVELIARRTYVADTVAQVKAERDLPTTDESQEERVMERAGENAERFEVDANLVKAIFRLLIELNKVEQREQR